MKKLDLPPFIKDLLFVSDFVILITFIVCLGWLKTIGLSVAFFLTVLIPVLVYAKVKNIKLYPPDKEFAELFAIYFILVKFVFVLCVCVFSLSFVQILSFLIFWCLAAVACWGTRTLLDRH